METGKEIRARYVNIEWALNENLGILCAANEAKVSGYYGSYASSIVRNGRIPIKVDK